MEVFSLEFEVRYSSCLRVAYGFVIVTGCTSALHLFQMCVVEPMR